MTSKTAVRPQTTSARSHGRTLGLVGAVAIGVVLALQSRVNGALGQRLGDGITTAQISFVVGLLALLACTAVMPAAWRGLRGLLTSLRQGELRLWQCLGGACGAFLVFSQGFSAAALGVALFTVALVAGQVSSGLAVDRWGLGPGGRQHITANRVAGAAVAIAAVLVAVLPKLGHTNASALVAVPLLAGVATAWQQAVNGRVKHAADSAVTAALVNFAVGTIVLGIVMLGALVIRGLPTQLPAEPWLYSGGLLGVVVAGTATVLVRHTGVLLLVMGMITGQLAGALLMDVFLPVAGAEVQVTTLIGTGLTFLAVLIASVPRDHTRATDTSLGG